MTTETKTLTYDHIVALALEHGFKLKPQVDGRMALNDYVIGFARAVYDIGHAAAKAETADVGEPVAFAHFAKNGNIRLWAPERPRDLDGNAAQPLYTADQLAAAVAAERERCANLAADLSADACVAYANGQPMNFREAVAHAITALLAGGAQ